MKRSARSTLFALLLGLLVVLLAAGQSLHEQLADHDSLHSCELCVNAPDTRSMLPPLALLLPALILDLSPQILLPAWLAPLPASAPRARAPPSVPA